MKLLNKTIVLTGGTSGIGRQLVEQLVGDNQLIVLGRDAEKLSTLKKKWPSIITFQVDLADVNQVHLIAQSIASAKPEIDLLINNAAAQFMPKFTDEAFTFDTVKTEVDTNFTSVCALIHGLLPALLASESSRVININSALGLVPKASSAVYCATKGALNIFSQSLRYQLEGSVVGVQQAFLPLVDTAMTKGRGKNKISSDVAATEIIAGIEKGEDDFDIGATRFLRVLNALAPFAARKLLKAS
ncbi:SDR family NAD(P)-dependent oxidoreductase [Grimontia sp. S25]|uniref:SDR family NAD(P)-dependent oxidoreductase n=1 Tax=Grimontia sedimenti TaxID=2711294 RepID=A0A6M1R3Z4_9GAMM|nr:SDR family NAD(P)-dependent oxidoreductase [Grimontia sedimenti]NGN96903.1 SDR family NAD(P)-dependent oxidoreductase [Grimontia sedimenti]